MPKKIDPLNKKQYGAVTAMLTVADKRASGLIVDLGPWRRVYSQKRQASRRGAGASSFRRDWCCGRAGTHFSRAVERCG